MVFVLPASHDSPPTGEVTIMSEFGAKLNVVSLKSNVVVFDASSTRTIAFPVIPFGTVQL